MKYREIYLCWVWDEVKKGVSIHALDKESQVVFSINEMAVKDAVDMIKDAEGHPDRFTFWTKEEEKVND